MIISAWRWIIISGLSFGVGGMAGILLVGISGAADSVDFALGGGVGAFAAVLSMIGIVSGGIGGGISGISLERLLDQSSRQDAKIHEFQHQGNRTG